MKNLKNLGKALTKAEQKMISGGRPVDLQACITDDTCKPSECCNKGVCIDDLRPACQG